MASKEDDLKYEDYLKNEDNRQNEDDVKNNLLTEGCCLHLNRMMTAMAELMVAAMTHTNCQKFPGVWALRRSPRLFDLAGRNSNGSSRTSTEESLSLSQGNQK